MAKYLCSLIGLRRVLYRQYIHTGGGSSSSTRVFMNIEVDHQPVGRIIYKIYDDLPGFTSPYVENFMKRIESDDPDISFIGSEFQRCGTGRGEMALFSHSSKPSDQVHHLSDINRVYEAVLHSEAYTNIDDRNPLIHDREGLLTAAVPLPESVWRTDVDFMRQLLARENLHKELYAITYDPDRRLDGKFQVIGEIQDGWTTLIEIETALVQPVSYYYPNNQHLLAYMEQTGEYDNPELIERIAMGLKSDSYVPGMMEAQIEIDSRSRLSSSLTVHGDTAEVPYENVKDDPKVKEALRNIPVAVQSQLETVDSMEAKEKERTIALDQRAELDIYGYNKAQKYPTLQNKGEQVSIPTVGPGPMTSSAIISNCGILCERKRLP